MNSLIQFAPGVEMRKLQREIDRLFEGLVPGGSVGTGDRVWVPRVDLLETEDAYLIHLDLPGVSRESIEINYHEGALAVSGERRTTLAEHETLLRCERSAGNLYRSFALPKAIDVPGISATFQDGVLSVRVPKAEESKPRRIEIS
jgi:HSP20 family protein